jgi:CheY-like chemotaxis protein
MKLLLVENDVASAELTTHVIRQIRQDVEVTITASGLEAIRYLELLSLPDLIITDLRMQELDGNRLINFVKSSKLYQSIPVIVLSASESPADIRWAYAAGCNGYFIKPMGLQPLIKLLQTVLAYWETSKRPEV